MMHLRHIGQLEAYIEEEHAGQRHTITAILPREEVEEMYRRLSAWDALVEALAFYADPGTYFAIGFLPDRPCGAFIDDASQVVVEWDSEPQWCAGAAARAALATLFQPPKEPQP